MTALDGREAHWFSWSAAPRLNPRVQAGAGVGLQCSGAPMQAGGLEHKGLCPEGLTVRGPQRQTSGEAMSEQRESGASVGRRPGGRVCTKRTEQGGRSLGDRAPWMSSPHATHPLPAAPAPPASHQHPLRRQLT